MEAVREIISRAVPAAPRTGTCLINARAARLRAAETAGREKPLSGLSHVFAINVLAPYLLTSLLLRPRRLVFLSSGLHHAGNPASQC